MSPLAQNANLIFKQGYNSAFADPDVQTYLSAVEAADGQALEYPVAVAIDEFIRGCKQDGIWNAIKASCILAGARTLNGALVPLAGTAPTNFNFVAGDYNRKTGLVGNGTSKYLSSNRNNTDDPQNNKHLSCYVSSVSLASGQISVLIGTEAYDVNRWSSIVINNGSGATGIEPWINGSSFPGQIIPIATSGFIGASRSSSTSINSRASLTSYTRSVTSGTPLSSVINVFRAAGVYGVSARIAFYSIGESLDLAKLDTRVTALINTLGTVIP